jgi:hypothetical protein
VIDAGADPDAIVERNVALLQQMGLAGWEKIFAKSVNKD